MKILITSSNWLVREGIASFINHQSGCEVVESENLSEPDLINRILQVQPDVIFLDIDNYGEMDFRLILHLNHVLPSISVIILSSEYSEEKVISALSNGARGFLSKKMSKPYLLSCLKALKNGELLLPEKMVDTVVSELFEISKKNEIKKNQMLSKLTYRELEVLKCLKNEETNKEIATNLVISINTVRIHVHNILKKLNVQNRREAARFVKQSGNFV